MDPHSPFATGQPVTGWRELLGMSDEPPQADQNLTSELRTVALFQYLTDEQLDVLCANGRIENFPAGTLCHEGDAARRFYVLIAGGDVVLSKRSGQTDIEIHRTAQRGTYFGGMSGQGGPFYEASVRLTTPSRLFVLDAEFFAQFMHTVWPVAAHLLEGHLVGGLRQRQILGQREMLLALGTITAGLTHHLNNPAAATARAVADLRDSIAELPRHLALVAEAAPAALGALIRLQVEIAEQARTASPSSLTPLQVSDREDRICEWLEDHGIEKSWEYASTFVDAGLDVAWLERISETLSAGASVVPLNHAVSWLKHIIDTELRIAEIAEASSRISTLLAGAKRYAHLDRGAYQSAHVNDLLHSTLLMFGDRIGPSGGQHPVTLVTEIDHGLPEILCYPGDLNQVWTQLIDNALDAMNGRGTLTVRTMPHGEEMIRVEICDDGPGVPEHLTERIFTPFFTTKPVGMGAGLGLDTAWRVVVDQHHGTLTVQSVPGDTRFSVCLPLRAPAPKGVSPETDPDSDSDEVLLQ